MIIKFEKLLLRGVAILIFAYARVSKKDQNLELQIDALKKYGVEEIYQEKMTGTKTDRPELEQLLKVFRKGDKVVVYKLDLISRATKHLIELAEFFEKKEIDFRLRHMGKSQGLLEKALS
jgi:DNA invertase Pin-like site-specific DNA recombinase